MDPYLPQQILWRAHWPSQHVSRPSVTASKESKARNSRLFSSFFRVMSGLVYRMLAGLCTWRLAGKRVANNQIGHA